MIKKLNIRKPDIKVPDRKAIKNSFRTVRSRNGAYSAAAIALVIVIAIAVNLVCGKLPATVQQVDLSSNKIYEISDTTKKVLKKLDEKITITVLAEKDETDERVKKFLDKYAAQSGKIKLKWIDPVAHPTALTEYEAESDTVVVSCEATDRTAQIPISDILVESYSYYGYSGEATSFDGDGQLTAAINEVTGTEKKKAYCITGHGEEELGTTVASLFTKAGIDTEEYNLVMKGEVPEDADVLIMNGLATDISDDEYRLLNKYIKSGGNVVILLAQDSPESGNIVKLLKQYRITQEKGYIADMERNYQNNYYYIFPNIVSSGDMSEGLSSGMVMMGYSRGFTIEESSDGINAYSILETSDYGYAVSDDSEEEGTFAVGAQATYTASEIEDSDGDDSDSDSGDVVTGTLTVFGSSSLIDESLTGSFTGLDNNTLFMNAVTTPIGGSENNVAIEAKSLETQYNTPSHPGLFSILIIFIIPIAVLILGFVSWMKRRKR